MSEEILIERILKDRYSCDLTHIGDGNVREEFDIDGRCADGVGHTPICDWIVVEVKSTNLRKALSQINNTERVLNGHNHKTKEAVILLKVLSRYYKWRYRIIGGYLHERVGPKEWRRVLTGGGCPIRVLPYS